MAALAPVHRRILFFCTTQTFIGIITKNLYDLNCLLRTLVISRNSNYYGSHKMRLGSSNCRRVVCKLDLSPRQLINTRPGIPSLVGWHLAPSRNAPGPDCSGTQWRKCDIGFDLNTGVGKSVVFVRRGGGCTFDGCGGGYWKAGSTPIVGLSENRLVKHRRLLLTWFCPNLKGANKYVYYM